LQNTSQDLKNKETHMNGLKWIKPSRDFGDVCPVFVKRFKAEALGKRATISITAHGVYEAELNGKRIGEYIFAPGWTSKRLQYQEYDISSLLREDNILTITVGKGWYRSPLALWRKESQNDPRTTLPGGIVAQIKIDEDVIAETDESWQVREGGVRFSEIYDGEVYDANTTCDTLENVKEYPGPIGWQLVPQQGPEIREQDYIKPKDIIITPKGETVIDFGQNITGYVYFTLSESTTKGDEVEISCAEVLDENGNFYTDNYRKSKSKLRYTARDGAQSYKPKHTFFGFRYIRLDKYPGGAVEPGNFTAIAIHSQMKRTGFFECANPLVNQLYENIIWGQKGNFLDVPTDCPQRDERLGWTGDAQVFVKAALYNYDCETFFAKWLTDLALDQQPNGQVPNVVPDALWGAGGRAAWGDAATVCPWQVYLAYGNKNILANQYGSMCKWVDYITASTNDMYLWTGGTQFGDWLALDSSPSRHDFIASAFYAHSTQLTIKAGKVLGLDTQKYEALHENIVKTFNETFDQYETQTECALAIEFKLAHDPQQAIRSLVQKIKEAGDCIQTGFIGTPHILHALSRYGHTSLAYTLLLRESYPSWLYPVTKNATTIWERWDGIKPSGELQTADMNSFNHYAYGAVADWMYGTMAGITPMEEYPGYKKIQIAPQPDPRVGWVAARFITRDGLIESKWKYVNGKVRYDIKTPSPSIICINGQSFEVMAGQYTFYS